MGVLLHFLESRGDFAHVKNSYLNQYESTELSKLQENSATGLQISISVERSKPH